MEFVLFIFVMMNPETGVVSTAALPVRSMMECTELAHATEQKYQAENLGATIRTACVPSEYITRSGV